VSNSVLVLGAGIAGVTAADRLSRFGVEVHLVEQQASIGGHAAAMGCKATDTCLRCNVCVAAAAFRALRTSSAVHVHTEATLARLDPGPGPTRFRATLMPTGTAAKTAAALDVDAVILATGFTPFNPQENNAYGYGRVPNVITGTEAERQLAEKHSITRPSDGRPPRRVAFIQCVGSRTDEVFRRAEDTSYCSTVCCAYALRMARQILHRVPATEVTVFHMDLQHFGKRFDDFYRESSQAMRWVRSRPAEVLAGPDGTIVVRYAAETPNPPADAGVREDTFDLLILAVGLRPAVEARRVADRTGVAVDPCGFFGLKGALALSDLQRAGIYAVGACERPQDIAGCVAQAEAVSALVLSELGR